MFGHTAHASNAYRRLAVESAALGADRHQLIGLLFSNVLAAIEEARAAIRRGDVGAKALASSRAIRLLDEGLKAAVDRSVDELGESLFQLYEYCARRLLRAQLKNDDAGYEEVATLLRQIASAWTSISPPGNPSMRSAA